MIEVRFDTESPEWRAVVKAMAAERDLLREQLEGYPRPTPDDSDFLRGRIHELTTLISLRRTT